MIDMEKYLFERSPDIQVMTLPEFKAAYARGRRRAELYEKLLEELDNLREQCNSFHIIVFGSYITDKKEPGDIDLMISLIPRQDCVYDIIINGLRRIHEKEIDIQYQKAQYYLKNTRQLVDYFNSNPLNRKEEIKIFRAVELHPY